MSTDVVIVGGGLAGSTLAIQLSQRVPSLSIVVVERTSFPVPEAAHKVGESTVEMGSHYYNEVLGLSHALIPCKIPKFGLRYFYPHGDNSKIELRPELGQTHYHTVGSTNFDRGRQENILRDECIARGIRFVDGAKVSDVELDAGGHRVTWEHAGQTETLEAKWVVDATGRRGLLKRKLDLAQSNGHAVGAAWFRIGESLAVDDMSDDAQWQRRVPFGMRRLSTNHFMGKGYWLWMIPLANGSISVGIVADPEHHPIETYNTLERARQWLSRHEPGAYALMEPHLSAVQDFRVQKRFSYGAKQVFSSDRWALTGEAGVFVDPFYSPGSDFIAMSNGFITELVAADVEGGDLATLARAYDRQYLQLYRSFLGLYEGQYSMFGNAQVMSLKIVFDYSGYWGSTALLYFQNKLHDLAFLKSVTVDMIQVHRLTTAGQKFFRKWHALDDGAWAQAKMINYQTLDYLGQWQAHLTRSYTDEELRRVLRANRQVLELVTAWLYRRATGSDAPVNPYKLDLDAADLVNPPRTLDMFEDLNDYVNANTEQRDGMRVLREAPARATG